MSSLTAIGEGRCGGGAALTCVLRSNFCRKPYSVKWRFCADKIRYQIWSRLPLSSWLVPIRPGGCLKGRWQTHHGRRPGTLTRGLCGWLQKVEERAQQDRQDATKMSQQLADMLEEQRQSSATQPIGAFSLPPTSPPLFRTLFGFRV